MLATAAVAVFGGSTLLVRPKISEWNTLREKQAETLLRIQQDMRLVEKRDEYAEKLGELSKLLPAFPENKEMDVYWLSVVDGIASRHGVELSKRQSGTERRHGDVYEMLIECKDWEADLDGLVHFLFDLHTVGAMFDMRQLLIKPRGKGGLRGRFSLYCAYTREPANEPARTE